MLTVEKLPTFGVTASANTLWSAPSAMIWTSVIVDVGRNDDDWAATGADTSNPGAARQSNSDGTSKVLLSFANALPNPLEIRGNFYPSKA